MAILFSMIFVKGMLKGWKWITKIQSRSLHKRSERHWDSKANLKNHPAINWEKIMQYKIAMINSGIN